MLIPHKATRKSYLADLRPAVCAGPVASERTRTTEFDLLVRDPAKANCRHDVEEWRQHSSLVAEHWGRSWTRVVSCAADTRGVIHRTSLPMQH